jgi:hypothetical protein
MLIFAETAIETDLNSQLEDVAYHIGFQANHVNDRLQ